MLVVVCFVFGNVLVNVLGLSSRFIMWDGFALFVWLWYYLPLCEYGFNVFVKRVHILGRIDKVALFAFVNSVLLCGLGLRFWFGRVMMRCFCFCELGHILC